MKILLAVDGSEYTRKMLDYVCANRALFDAGHSYTLLNVQLALPPHARSAVGGDVVQSYYQEEAEKVLQPARELVNKQGWKADSVFKVGHAGDVIAAFAKEGGFELILMGSHGHGALGRLVMGSVASEVLARCDVPVLLVR